MNNSKTNVNGLDVGEWKIVPIDLKNLSDDFNTLKTKIYSLESKIPDATTLIPISQYNTDKQNLEKKIRDIDKKIPDASGLVTTTVLNTNISKVENKIPNNSNLVITKCFHYKY